MVQTATTTNNNQLKGFWVDKALLTLESETPLYDLGVKNTAPKGKGTTVYWNSWRTLGGASSTLAEGGSNTAVALSSRRVSAVFAQYGRGVDITDLAEYFNVLETRAGAQQRLRHSAKVTFERIAHTAIFKDDYFTQNNSTTVILSAMMSGLASSMSDNTGTHNDSNNQFKFPGVYGASVGRLSAVSSTAPTISAKASLYAIRKVTNELILQNALPFSDGKWVGYCHPNFLHILKQDPAFREWNQHQFTDKTMHIGEVMTTDGVRWVQSTEAPRYAVAAHSINLTFVFGQGAYGVTEAMGGLEMFLITGADKSDKYNTVTSLTYKITATAAALNPSAGRILFTHELK